VLALPLHGVGPITQAHHLKEWSRIALVREYELGYVYSGILVLFGTKLIFYAMFPTEPDDTVEQVQNPDQQIYKATGAEGAKRGYILMDTEGDVGH
jgi:hypothetical protein